MRWLMSSLLLAGLCVWLGADRSVDDGEVRKDRRKSVDAPTSQPAPADDQASDDPAMRPYGLRRPWLQGDPRGRYGAARQGDRWGQRQPGVAKSLMGDDGQSLPPEQVKRVMEFARENFPALYQRLVRVRDANPTLFVEMVKRARGPISEILRVGQYDPEAARKLIELHRVEIDLSELRGQYQASRSNEQREQLKSKMRGLVSKRCDLRLEKLRLEVRDLEKRLLKAKDEVGRREKDKDGLVDRELKKLLAPGPVEPAFGRAGSGPGPKGGKRGQAPNPSPPSEGQPKPSEKSE